MAGRREVNVDELSNEFITDRIKYRGVIYELKELSASKYNKTVQQATEKDENTGIETFNAEAHTRILLGLAVKVGGKSVDVEDLYAQGNRLIRSLSKKVLDLHLADEPEEVIDDDEGEAAAASTSA